MRRCNDRFLSPDTFWTKVKTGAPDQCWPWNGSYNPYGYGRLQVRGKTYMAHRLALEMASGKFSDDICVLHRCDNPSCCNPSHLFLGTQSDNMKDMAAKGRGRTAPIFGEAHRWAKLTEADVREIRRLRGKKTQHQLASIFKISQSVISGIQLRHLWSHVS